MNKVNSWSSFPPPPAYAALFSDSSDVEPPPPPPVIEGEYFMFGEPLKTEISVNQDLSEAGSKQLFSVDPDRGEPDVKRELCKLNRSLVFCFHEFLQMLVHRPEGCDEKLKDLEAIQINIHYLMNSYRPHQARHVVRDTMRHQVELRSAQCANIQQALEYANSSLQECVHSLPQCENENGENTAQQSTDREGEMEVEVEAAARTSTDSSHRSHASVAGVDLEVLQRALDML